MIDLGAAASNVDAKPVSAHEEIRRLDPVIAGLQHDGTPVSVDSFLPDVQRFAVARRVDYLNDIQGFPDPSLYPELAAARCKLVVMHAVQGRGRAQRLELLRCRGMGSHGRVFYRADCGARASRHRPRAHHHRSRHGLLFEQPARSFASCAGPARRAEARLSDCRCWFRYRANPSCGRSPGALPPPRLAPRPWQPSFSPPSRVSIISAPTTRAVSPMRFGLHRRCAQPAAQADFTVRGIGRQSRRVALFPAVGA